jgi:hypothetical protein
MNGQTVAWVDIFTWLFLIANAGRVLAYMPQIMAAWKCPAGARSVSILTWSYFAFAHLTALLYAMFVLQDSRSAWVFAGNLSFTAFLVALLAAKRLAHRRVSRSLQTCAQAADFPEGRNVLAMKRRAASEPAMAVQKRSLS